MEGFRERAWYGEDGRTSGGPLVTEDPRIQRHARLWSGGGPEAEGSLGVERVSGPGARGAVVDPRRGRS
jgi:hypothetical protein